MHAEAPMNYSKVFLLDIELGVCHFFIYGIPQREPTTVFRKIERAASQAELPHSKTRHQNRGSYTARCIDPDLRAGTHTRRTVNLHRKLVPSPLNQRETD